MAYSSHPAGLNLKNARSRAVNSRQPTAHKPALEQILIVGGGAGGLELATRLGNSLGKRGRAQIELIDKSRTHLWKPLLHEIAAGSMDLGVHELDYLAQSYWHHFRFRLGEIIDLNRERREVQVAAVVDAGATGVELAAELHNTTRELVAYGLDRIDPDRDIKLNVIEAADRILPALPQRLSDAATKLLQSKGVRVRTSARVAEVLP